MEDTAILLLVVVLVVIALALICWLIGSDLKAWFTAVWPVVRGYSMVHILP